VCSSPVDLRAFRRLWLLVTAGIGILPAHRAEAFGMAVALAVIGRKLDDRLSRVRRTKKIRP